MFDSCEDEGGLSYMAYSQGTKDASSNYMHSIGWVISVHRWDGHSSAHGVFAEGQASQGLHERGVQSYFSGHAWPKCCYLGH